jgi:hypothetical protein
MTRMSANIFLYHENEVEVRCDEGAHTGVHWAEITQDSAEVSLFATLDQLQYIADQISAYVAAQKENVNG